MPTIPIVHMNGSGKENLMSQARNIVQALRKVQEAMSNASPHGRDYYPKPGTLEKAVAEWRENAEAIEKVLDYYMEFYHRIADPLRGESIERFVSKLLEAQAKLVGK